MWLHEEDCTAAARAAPVLWIEKLSLLESLTPFTDTRLAQMNSKKEIGTVLKKENGSNSNGPVLIPSCFATVPLEARVKLPGTENRII